MQPAAPPSSLSINLAWAADKGSRTFAANNDQIIQEGRNGAKAPFLFNECRKSAAFSTAHIQSIVAVRRYASAAPCFGCTTSRFISHCERSTSCPAVPLYSFGSKNVAPATLLSTPYFAIYASTCDRGCLFFVLRRSKIKSKHKVWRHICSLATNRPGRRMPR